MKIINIQEGYARKFDRQAGIEDLELHASGHCAHIGKISPGCLQCFVQDDFSLNIFMGDAKLHLPAICNAHCAYCPDDHSLPHVRINQAISEKDKEDIENWKLPERWKRSFIGKSASFHLQNRKNVVPTIAFSGQAAEPLLYVKNVIVEYMNFFKHVIEKSHLGVPPWYYLYTNGVFANPDMILRLKELGFDEIRFHLGATNFSKTVYNNMKTAADCINTITVETPAWPPHRQNLFEMLSIIEDIGVQHLNIGQIVLLSNRVRIEKALNDAEFYQASEIYLDDKGLVYDIIDEVIKKNYSYSVLDCNCFVKQIQRAQGKWILHDVNIDGLCDIEKWRNKLQNIETSNKE